MYNIVHCVCLSFHMDESHMPVLKNGNVKLFLANFVVFLIKIIIFNRRNLPGDRQKALEIMIPLVEQEDQVASDMYCLVGRIYKDMFLESGFIDIESRDKGTFW